MMMDRNVVSAVLAEAQQIVLSLPEVDALCTRTARGAGYSWGISEECGQAMAWLASYGFDWAPVLLRRLSGERGGNVTPQPVAWTAEGPICALYCGSTLADFAALPEGPGKTGVALGQIHDPLLALPFVAQVANYAPRGRIAIRGWLLNETTG